MSHSPPLQGGFCPGGASIASRRLLSKRGLFEGGELHRRGNAKLLQKTAETLPCVAARRLLGAPRPIGSAYPRPSRMGPKSDPGVIRRVDISSGIQASLAGRYAIALFELARDEKQLESVGASL